MKRWRERDIDAELDKPKEEAPKPLWVEQIAPRSQRDRYGLPVLIGAFLILAFVVATISRFVAIFGGAAATPLPPTGPTPIPWVNAIVVKGPPAEPTPAPSASPSPALDSAGPAQSGFILSPEPKVAITAQGPAVTQYWSFGVAQHFTLDLTNNSTEPIPLDPCPSYRMYFVGTDETQASIRLLNCAAISKTLEVGQTISFDMVYITAEGDPIGTQTLVWEWFAPSNYQAITFFSVYILGADGSAAP